MSHKKYKVVWYDNGPTVPVEQVVYEGSDKDAARRAYDGESGRTSTLFESEADLKPFSTPTWNSTASRSVVGNP